MEEVRDEKGTNKVKITALTQIRIGFYSFCLKNNFYTKYETFALPNQCRES